MTFFEEIFFKPNVYVTETTHVGLVNQQQDNN